MLNMLGWMLVTVATLLPRAALAALNCGASEYLVTGAFGVNPVVRNLPSRLGLPGGAVAELRTFQAAWLAEQHRERDQENVVIDFNAETITQVNVYDGDAGALSAEAIRAAELDPSSNFARGQLNMNWCMPMERRDGLLFAIYGVGDALAGFQAGPFAVDDQGRATAVLNEAITNQVGLEFNSGGAEDTRQDIEAVTGFYPPRSLAEAIFQRDIPAMLRDEVLNQALFHNPTDGVVVGNLFIVTGDNAQAYAPTSVGRVLHQGMDALNASNAVSDLDERLGPISFEVAGSRRHAYLIEGRAEVDVEPAACTGGISILQASFQYPATLHSVIELWRGETLLATRTNAGLGMPVLCNGAYRVSGYRSIRGVVVDSSAVPFELVSMTNDIVGVDLDGDPATAELLDVDPVDGFFDSGLSAAGDCGGNPAPLLAQLLVLPDVPGSFGNSELPANVQFDQATGAIQFAPSCAQVGAFYDVTFTFNDGISTSPPKTLRFVAIP